MGKRDYDPLSVIRSPAAIRKRLQMIEEQARRLHVLLRTAEQIEKDGDKPAENRQRVPHE